MELRTSTFSCLSRSLVLIDSAFFSIGMYLNFFVVSHIHVHAHVFYDKIFWTNRLQTKAKSYSAFGFHTSESL